MHDHALKVLEYSQLIELVGEQAQTGAGKRLVHAMRPARDIDGILDARGAAPDALAMLEAGLSVPGFHFEEIDEILRRVAPVGAVLEGDDLVACRSLLVAVGDVHAALLAEPCRRFGRLAALAAQLEPAPNLVSALRRCLDDDGTLFDSASSRLAELRREGASLERGLQRSLERILKDPAFSDAIQDQFVTSRNGRFVIPVRRSEKGMLNGIIHDHSNSGQTLFIEPSATVGLGNDLATVRLQERDEMVRILGRLSDRVREIREPLARNQSLLARLDAAFCVARWARSYHCVFPHFGSATSLLSARHPLLVRQFRQEGHEPDVIPLTLELSRETKALAVTGSNTGGKTVALKTLGLLTLAAQAGLPVPIDPESELEIFDDVYADIGDEQSLEASLSTFSAHISNINRILRAVENRRCLVLLDELGAGTDPLEGGALACSILEALAESDVLTVATTHLGAVKNFVHEKPGMLNAAVRFNTETLRPEYVLDVGRPGASHALLIAQRLDLPERVLTNARAMLSSDHMRLETVLAKMEDDQRRITSREREMRGAEKDLLRNRDELKAELDTLRKERRQLMHDAYRQAEAVVENTRRDMERQLREIRETTKDEEAKAAAAKARGALAEKERKLQRGRQQTAPRAAHPVSAEDLRKGARVWVEKLHDHGLVISVADGRRNAIVDVRGMRFTLKAVDLGKEREPEKQSEHVVKLSRPRPQGDGRSVTELNLIGNRVDEATEKLEGFISQALMANVEEVRIVHGFGTGRLQRGVHECLRSHPDIKSFRLGKHQEDPGGAGATIAILK